MQVIRQRAGSVSYSFIPMAVTLFMALFSAAPIRLTGVGAVFPQLVYVSLYYWGIFRPGNLPYPFLFLLGLMEDTFSGFPLGVSAFLNIGFSYLLMIERPLFGKMLFASVWIGFILLTAIAGVAQWLLLSFSAGMFLPVFLALLKWSATCLAYPLLHKAFARMFRASEAG